MNLTIEQQAIINHFISNLGITAVNSVAGSGKTSLLRAIATTLPHTRALLMCYNASIAKEASSKFPSTVDCRTTHSLAYQAVVVPNKLLVGNFSYRNITERIPYLDKCAIVDAIREFCLSAYTDFATFNADTELLNPIFEPTVDKYLDLMHSGQIECTHEFYLKLYHILLANGSITYDPFDFIAIDEAGDLNPVTIEIFHLLPSDRKIAVGDPCQNIYSFNHTVNYFDQLPPNAVLFPMTQSFRVSDKIAPHIESFCTSYIDPNMKFTGTPQSHPITTRAYITRTNSTLIAKMIELDQAKIPYRLIRKPDEIFRLPLILCSLKYKSFISAPEYKHLQDDVNDWFESSDLRDKYATPLSYLASIHSDDFQLKQGISLLIKYGANRIIETYKSASSHYKSKCSYVLATSHSSKGLEFDEVTIGPDLNLAVNKVLDKLDARTPLNRDDRDTLNLYYVACSRASIQLNNATCLIGL